VASISASSAALLSSALTAVAQADTSSTAARASLHEKSLALYIEAPTSLQLIVEVIRDEIIVRELNEHDRPTEYLVGNPIEIYRALNNQPHDCAVTGDISHWQHYIDLLNINWPALLEPIIGVDAAAILGNQLNNATELRANAAAELSRMASTFNSRERGHYNPMPTVSAAVDALTDLIKRR